MNIENKIASSFRAGRYITQLNGCRAFCPETLPPHPPVRFDGELSALLSQADRALGRLDGSVMTLPDSDLFVFMYVRKEAVLSSQIEGIQSSLQDLLAAEEQVLSPDRPRDVKEVMNCVRTMNYGLQRLADLPVSVRLMREIHAELLRGVRGSTLTPGELRTTQNWIGPAGCTLREAVFVPPPPHRMGEDLSHWERFIHGKDNLPLLIKIGLAHAQFETIHPFLDGNGRVGRLLITFLLCQSEVLQKPVLYLSHFFKKHRQQYYDELQSVRDNGSWEQWLVFFLRGVVEVSTEAADTARHILDLREQHRRIIMETFGRATGNGLRALELLFERPIISVNDVRTLNGTTYPAANALVDRLVHAGILYEFTGHARHRQFRYTDYINLFDDSPVEANAMKGSI